MPKMGGYRTTQLIRQRELENTLSAIPIIALTANVMQDDRQLCIKAGMNDYLPKPFTKLQMTNILQRWLVNIFDTKKI